MDSDRDDGGCDQSPAVQTKGRQQADKRQTGPKIQTKFRQKADKAKILGKCVKKFKIGWPPMVWLVGQKMLVEATDGGEGGGQQLWKLPSWFSLSVW